MNNTEFPVFVSSKMIELQSEREMLYELIPTLSNGLAQLHAWVFEQNAPASAKSIREEYLKVLRDSQLYLGIFWNEYGEWTIDEFNKATQWGLDRHIYVKDVEAHRRDARLQSFLEGISNVEGGITTKWYKTIDELRQAVTNSIAEWLESRLFRPLVAESALIIEKEQDVIDRPTSFIGRTSTFDEVMESLANGHPVLLQGFGGTGKTALAAEVTALWVKTRKARALWLRVGDGNIQEVLTSLFRPFDVKRDIIHASQDTKIQYLRDLLLKENIKLVVLDDAWNQETLTVIAGSITSLAGLLVTSRQRFPLFSIISIGALSDTEALQLLSVHAHSDLSHDADATAVCQIVDNLAFAVRLAGITLAYHQISASELLRSLRNRPHELDTALIHKGREPASVIQMLDTSLNYLYSRDKEAHAAFFFFGESLVPQMTTKMYLHLRFFHDVPDAARVSLELNDILIEMMIMHEKRVAPVGTIRQMEALVEAGLAQHVRYGEALAYRIHDVAHSYTRLRADAQSLWNAVNACILYLKVIRQITKKDLEFFYLDESNFYSVLRYLSQENEFEHVMTLAQFLYEHFWYVRGTKIQDIESLKLGLKAAQQLGEERKEGNFYYFLATAYHELNWSDEALPAAKKAVEIGEKHNVSPLLSSALLIQGYELLRAKDEEGASACFARMEQLARASGDIRRLGHHLAGVAGAYENYGNYDLALRNAKDALQAFEAVKETFHANNMRALITHLETSKPSQTSLDRPDKDMSTTDANANLEKMRATIPLLKQQLEAVRESGDQRTEFLILDQLLRMSSIVGNDEDAFQYGNDLLNMAIKLEHPVTEASVRYNLAMAYFVAGRLTSASEQTARVIDLASRFPDIEGMRTQLFLGQKLLAQIQERLKR